MSRYSSEVGPQAAAGWQLSRLSSPSELFGANGMRVGPDGKIYVVQAFGSQVSRGERPSGYSSHKRPPGRHSSMNKRS